MAAAVVEPLENRWLLSVSLLKDIVPGSGSPTFFRRVTVGDTLFFTADDGVHGGELWKSDGTPAGTMMVKDIIPGPGGSMTLFTSLAAANGKVFFGAAGGGGPVQLWTSDGTEAGTVALAAVPNWFPSIQSYVVGTMASVNGTLFFGTTSALWKSDGTPEGTRLVKDGFAGFPSNSLQCLTDVNGTLFFVAYTWPDGWGLWKSDGTAAGTVRIKSGYADSDALRAPLKSLINVNGTLFFVASDGLWKSDGTTEGTVLIANADPSGVSEELWLASSQNKLFFNGSGGSPSTEELWASDGTAAGAWRIKDINPQASSSPFYLCDLGGTLYFAAEDGVNGTELWKSDGTAAGTVMVKDIFPGSQDSVPRAFTSDDRPGQAFRVVGDSIFFVANDGIHGCELWRSDGTTAGTNLVWDVCTGSAGSSPSRLVAGTSKLFFTADDGAHGLELWAWSADPPDRPPVAMAGGPYAIKEGDTLSLDASGSSDPDGDVLTYSWDVNGNGVFGDATGVRPVLSWSRLLALGLGDFSIPWRQVRVRVDDGRGRTSVSWPVSLTVRGVPPTVTVSAGNISTEGTAYSFTVTYADSTAVDVSSLDDNDILVTGPNGFRQLARFAGASSTSDGTPRTATYEIVPPGDGWDAADSGSYDIILQANEVQDIYGNFAAGRTVGSFQVSIAAAQPDSFAGSYNDIAYDANGTLHLAWYDPAARNLRYACRATDGSWSAAAMVDGSGDVGQFLSLAMDASGRPAVSYYDATNADLKYARFDGSHWSVETVDGGGRVGMYSSLGFDGRGNPFISYYYRTRGDLRLASFDGSGWNITTVDGTDDCGRHSSLALNPASGRWAIAYESSNNGIYRYAEQNRRGWGLSSVDDTLGGGGYISLAFDAQGRPGFSYYDAWYADLKYAHFDGNAWQVRTVVNKGLQGMYSSLFYDGARANILYFNRTANAAYRAQESGGAWSASVLRSGGGRCLSVTLGPAGQESFGWVDGSGILKVEEL